MERDKIEKLELLKLGGEKKAFKVASAISRKAKTVKTKKKVSNSLKKDLLKNYKFKLEEN